MRSVGFLAVVMAAALALVTPVAAAPPSASDLTRAPAIQDVSIAPDGQHLVALTSPDGEVLDVSVWRTDTLGGQPVRIRSKVMRLLSVRFLKSDRLLVTAVQAITVDGDAGHVIRSYVTDLEGKTFSPLLPDKPQMLAQASDSTYDALFDADIISTLPMDPKHVLVMDRRPGGAGDIYSVDVYSMQAGRVLQASDKYSGYQVDLKGQLRARRYADFDNGALYVAQQIRDPNTGQWVELYRSYAKDRNLMNIVSFTTDPNIILVSGGEEGDKLKISEYDIKQKKVVDTAFQHKLFDADGVITSRFPGDVGRPLGFVYDAETPKIYWADPRLDALAKSAEQALGVPPDHVDWVDPGTGLKASLPVSDVASVDMAGWSDDFQYVLLEKSGPRQPPEYYLLHGGKLQLLGKARPWIDPAALGATKVVEYAARDGLMIPAFLTLPPSSFGPGPYPTLIEPHGGPWARDYLDWDVTGWTQYFASRGFAVLQPQFRGSRGWGNKLWRAGDKEWGQKMQDDNDDGVKWLIAQHIADPKRVAMFGYSYGGYAALAAAIRPNGLYQCSISGAGAGDLRDFVDETYDNRFEREYQMPTVAGLDPVAHAKDIQIPLLLYHGDHDQNVDPQQSRNFAAGAKASGKFVKLVEIKDMGHELTYWTPDNALEQLNLVDGFLKSDCKPGGL